MKIKLIDFVCAGAGMIGGLLSSFVGGWTLGLQVLITCMVIDFITGIITAIMLKSEHTENGGLRSNIAWKGLLKKIVTLIIVGLSYQLERVTGFTGIKDIVITGYIVNETISILENCGLMGIPMPSILKKVLEVMKKGVEEAEPTDGIDSNN